MLQMGDTVGQRYTAPKISAISYLFGTFSLLIMGDTERPRYTGFRGLSVRGITVLQCIPNLFISPSSLRATLLPGRVNSSLKSTSFLPPVQLFPRDTDNTAELKSYM